MRKVRDPRLVHVPAQWDPDRHQRKATANVDVRGAVPLDLKIKLAVAGGQESVTVHADSSDLLENVPYAHNDVDTKTLNTGNSEASCGTGTDVGFNTGSNGGNVPLNKLYVTLLNAIGATKGGAPITEFGVMDTSDVAKGITNPGELAALKA